MNVHAKNLRYKKVKDVVFLESVLLGKLYEVSYFNYDFEIRYGHKLVDYYTKEGISGNKQISTLKTGELVVEVI